MKKLLSAAVLACAVAAVAVPLAGANAPSVTTTDINRDVLIAAGPGTCAFDIVAHLEGTRVITDYTDRDGNLVRRVILLRQFTITYTNPLSGKSLSTPLAGPVIGEPQPDGSWLVTIPGNDGRFVIPGQGIVFANVGLRIGTHVGSLSGAIDDIIKSVGIQDDSEFPAVCSGLA